MNMKKLISSVLLSILMITLSPLSLASDAMPPIKGPVENVEVKKFSFNLLFSIYDFSYKNAMERQKQAAMMFSSTGWENFQKALLKSKLLESVKTNKYIVTTTPLIPPEVIKQGLKKGIYYWQVKFPAMIVFKNADYQQVQYINIKLHITYKDKLRAEEVVAEKGTPINCQQTSKGIIITPEAAKTEASK